MWPWVGRGWAGLGGAGRAALDSPRFSGPLPRFSSILRLPSSILGSRPRFFRLLNQSPAFILLDSPWPSLDSPRYSLDSPRYSLDSPRFSGPLPGLEKHPPERSPSRTARLRQRGAFWCQPLPAAASSVFLGLAVWEMFADVFAVARAQARNF